MLLSLLTTNNMRFHQNGHNVLRLTRIVSRMLISKHSPFIFQVFLIIKKSYISTNAKKSQKVPKGLGCGSRLLERGFQIHFYYTLYFKEAERAQQGLKSQVKIIWFLKPHLLKHQRKTYFKGIFSTPKVISQKKLRISRLIFAQNLLFMNHLGCYIDGSMNSNRAEEIGQDLSQIVL